MFRCTGYFDPRRVLLAGTLAALLGGGSPGVVAAAERPFILWTKQDAAAIRKKVETRPWARAASPRITQFRRIAQNERALVVAVAGRPGSGVDDRVMLRYGDDAEKPITLAGNGESFTFADYAYVRIGRDAVEVWGDLRAMKVRAEGRRDSSSMEKSETPRLRRGC